MNHAFFAASDIIIKNQKTYTREHVCIVYVCTRTKPHEQQVRERRKEIAKARARGTEKHRWWRWRWHTHSKQNDDDDKPAVFLWFSVIRCAASTPYSWNFCFFIFLACVSILNSLQVFDITKFILSFTLASKHTHTHMQTHAHIRTQKT